MDDYPRVSLYVFCHLLECIILLEGIKILRKWKFKSFCCLHTSTISLARFSPERAMRSIEASSIFFLAANAKSSYMLHIVWSSCHITRIKVNSPLSRDLYTLGLSLGSSVDIGICDTLTWHYFPSATSWFKALMICCKSGARLWLEKLIQGFEMLSNRVWPMESTHYK